MRFPSGSGVCRAPVAASTPTTGGGPLQTLFQAGLLDLPLLRRTHQQDAFGPGVVPAATVVVTMRSKV